MLNSPRIRAAFESSPSTNAFLRSANNLSCRVVILFLILFDLPRAGFPRSSIRFNIERLASSIISFTESTLSTIFANFSASLRCSVALARFFFSRATFNFRMTLPFLLAADSAAPRIFFVAAIVVSLLLTAYDLHQAKLLVQDVRLLL